MVTIQSTPRTVPITTRKVSMRLAGCGIADAPISRGYSTMDKTGDPRDPARREMLRQSLTLAGAAVLGSLGTAAADEPVTAPDSDPHPALGRTLRRLAFDLALADLAVR